MAPTAMPSLSQAEGRTSEVLPPLRGSPFPAPAHSVSLLAVGEEHTPKFLQGSAAPTEEQRDTGSALRQGPQPQLGARRGPARQGTARVRGDWLPSSR